MDDPVHQVATAFSLTAEKYDRFAEDHPNLTRIHSIVYAHLFKHLSPAAHILEINAGTGTDAIHLAQHAFFVYATDIAPGMLERLQEKVIRFGLEEQVRVQRCSFTELDKLKEEGFDAVFSNLGGLNCIPDLKPIIDTLPSVIRPGGIVVWVLMPHICLWELTLAYLVSSILLTGSSFWLIPRLGLIGASLAALATEMLQAVIFLLLARQYLSESQNIQGNFNAVRSKE